MPSKKDPQVNPINNVDNEDTAPRITDESSLVLNNEKATKPVSSRRKSSQTRTAKASKAITEPAVTAPHVESRDSIDIIEPIEAIHIETTESLDPSNPIEAADPLESSSPTSDELAVSSTQSKDKRDKISKKQRKESYSKEKLYIRNDLLKRIKALSKSNGKSFKTSFINDALEKSLNELEAAKE